LYQADLDKLPREDRSWQGEPCRAKRYRVKRYRARRYRVKRYLMKRYLIKGCRVNSAVWSRTGKRRLHEPGRGAY
jgi:hypothetical protein